MNFILELAFSLSIRNMVPHGNVSKPWRYTSKNNFVTTTDEVSDCSVDYFVVITLFIPEFVHSLHWGISMRVHFPKIVINSIDHWQENSNIKSNYS